MRTGEEFLALQLLHELEKPARGLAALLEEGDACLIGRALLGAAEGEEVSHREVGAGTHSRHAGLACASAAGRDRGGAEEHAEDLDDLRVFDRVAHARKMATRDVPGLVGHHADHLISTVGLDEQPRIEEDVEAARHEGVDLSIVDDDELDLLRIEPGRLPHGRAPGPQITLNLGVADAGDLRPPAALALAVGVGRKAEDQARNRNAGGETAQQMGPPGDRST